MTTSRLRAAAALTFAFIAASCGGDGSSGPTFSDSVSTADALGMADDLGDNVSEMATAMDFGGVSLILTAPAALTRLAPAGSMTTRPIGGRILTLPALVDFKAMAANPAGLQASAGEGCTYTGHGLAMGPPGFVDVNQNGIPDDLYFKIECTTTDSITNPDTVTIQYTLQEQSVKENFASLHGFTASFRTAGRLSDEFGGFEGGTFTGTETLDIRSGSVTHTHKFGFAGGGGSDGEESHFTNGTEWNGTFDPSAPIVLGDPLPDGTLSFTGRDFRTDDQTPLNLSFSLETTTPLAFSAACAGADQHPPFTAGVVLGKLNNNSSQASFTATFTACAVAPTITTSGTHDPVVSAVYR